MGPAVAWQAAARVRAKEEAAPDSIPALDPPAAAMRAEKNEQLAAALDQLSPPQRRVLLLRYYGHFSFAEIAEMIDCPLNTTLSHCRRGLEALRAMLVEKES